MRHPAAGEFTFERERVAEGGLDLVAKVGGHARI
jgi:hypothetical protein